VGVGGGPSRSAWRHNAASTIADRRQLLCDSATRLRWTRWAGNLR
jgi:hypothetical protein